ncbi:MAG: FecR family protein [Balneolales bacterium]|nr:FecR family protein [Balneolales bacterium]
MDKKTLSVVMKSILITLCLLASDLVSIQQLFAQERPLAIVRRFIPTVELASIDEETFVLDLTENLGEQLFSGDTLTTNKDGYALVIFMDNSTAKVKPESALIITGEEQAASRTANRRILLENGEIKLEVEPVGSGTFEVATSRSLASVKGTVFGATAFGYVWVTEGQVDVTALNSGQTVSLFQQMYAEVDDAGNTVESGTLTEEELQDLEEGFDELEEELIEKTIIIRFMDANGQIREVPITIFEKGN